MGEIVDSYNRRINYLRISLTDRCNLRCFYCFPVKNFRFKKREEILTNEEILRLIKIVIDLGIEKVRLTGGEPLLRKGIINLIENISEIKEIKDFSLTTNGIFLKKFAKQLKDAGSKRINISLDSLIAEKYYKITGCGNLEDTIYGIETAKEVGFSPIKINVVVLKGINDNELTSFIDFAKKNSLIIRFIEFMPVGNYKIWNKFFISEKEILKILGDKINKNSLVRKGEVAKYYSLKEDGGEIGIISSVSNRFCSRCNKFRITADGFIKPCLLNNSEIEIKKFLRDGTKDKEIKEIFLKSASLKLNSYSCQEESKRLMFQIGG